MLKKGFSVRVEVDLVSVRDKGEALTGMLYAMRLLEGVANFPLPAQRKRKLLKKIVITKRMTTSPYVEVLESRPPYVPTRRGGVIFAPHTWRRGAEDLWAIALSPDPSNAWFWEEYGQLAAAHELCHLAHIRKGWLKVVRREPFLTWVKNSIKDAFRELRRPSLNYAYAFYHDLREETMVWKGVYVALPHLCAQSGHSWFRALLNSVSDLGGEEVATYAYLYALADRLNFGDVKSEVVDRMTDYSSPRKSDFQTMCKTFLQIFDDTEWKIDLV